MSAKLTYRGAAHTCQEVDAVIIGADYGTGAGRGGQVSSCSKISMFIGRTGKETERGHRAKGVQAKGNE